MQYNVPGVEITGFYSPVAGSPRARYKVLHHPRPAPPPYRPPPPPSTPSTPSTLMTEDLLVKTLEERHDQGLAWTSYGQERILVVGEAGEECWPEESLQLVTSRLTCLHRLLVQLEDTWTASYLTSAASALLSLVPAISCSLESSHPDGPLSLSCSLPNTGQLRVSPSLGGANLPDLRQTIQNHQHNHLNQIVQALQLINIPPEDILRVTTAASLLLHHRGQDGMKDLAELLGVDPDHLNNILNDNQNISARLSHVLTLRTVQSIVKKVNRTIKRRHALKVLCQNKTDDKKVARTTIKIVNWSFPAAGESKVLGHQSPELPQAVTEMFHDKSLCNFGFASHLFQEDSDTLISSDCSVSSAGVRVFCLDPDSSLVTQARELSLLEVVVLGMEDRLWKCYTTAQFSALFRCLARRESQDEAESVFSVLDLVADCDCVEICQEAGTIMLGLPAQQRLDLARQEKREESARRIQSWWRQRSYPPHLLSSLAESDLIETVLMKYETLQRQSESLVYSFAERSVKRGEKCGSYDSLDNLMTETHALPAAVLETENSYQNILQTLPPQHQTEPVEEEEELEFINQQIVLRTSQLYGIDLVRYRGYQYFHLMLR